MATNERTPRGGEQGERLEGSLTDGGNLPGPGHEEDRSFGAGRAASTPDAGRASDIEAGEGSGAAHDVTAGAGPSGEQSGYGNTPPR